MNTIDVELCGAKDEADNARDLLLEVEHSHCYHDSRDGGDGDYWEAGRMGVSRQPTSVQTHDILLLLLLQKDEENVHQDDDGLSEASAEEDELRDEHDYLAAAGV
mmetsp:Transcript_33683/g.72847  ORF Transcript_33683/g.72847 Transcript_33683/m.72847 type:complete len:105 (+) Transcript_33683:690-1004(+)